MQVNCGADSQPEPPMVTKPGFRARENDDGRSVTSKSFGNPPDLYARPSSAVLSEKEWHEGLYPASIGRVFVGEVPQQERFFLLEFNPEPGAQEEKSEPGAKLAGRDGRCQAHQENARVNGVPHEPVWPR